MEITSEIKAKVFAQYLGQKVKPNNDNIIGTLITIHESRINLCIDIPGRINLGHWGFDKCKLILKPLSAITDEDAIEVAKIEGLINAKISQREIGGIMLEAADTEDDYFSYKLLLLFNSEIFLSKNQKTTSKAFVIYQYLISKGYDLPNYLLGRKTLHEVGLAIYE